ncbi:MAG: hypothetical protein ACK42H_06280 [Planctomycetota bacterium]|jgi:hypothetical protein
MNLDPGRGSGDSSWYADCFHQPSAGLLDPWASRPFYPEVESVGGSLGAAKSPCFRAFDLFLLANNGLTRRAAAR